MKHADRRIQSALYVFTKIIFSWHHFQVGSEWPSPNKDPCETYTCEAGSGTVLKVQKIQKCNIHC